MRWKLWALVFVGFSGSAVAEPPSDEALGSFLEAYMDFPAMRSAAAKVLWTEVEKGKLTQAQAKCLQGQIDPQRLRGLHERRSCLRRSKDHDFRWPKFEASFFRAGCMVDASEHRHAPGSHGRFQPLNGFGGIVFACYGNQPFCRHGACSSCNDSD